MRYNMAWMYALDHNGTPINRKGDSGMMSQAIFRNEVGKAVVEDNAKPRVGVRMRVGSIYARSYSDQDYWTTTEIQEILREEVIDGVLTIEFRTLNSVYLWREI